ncbi:MAG: hypothetical protein KAX49_02420 [Halanaerobiales bacterium]|nr:hypothetical protein [Halanaerobiales bacterium]
MDVILTTNSPGEVSAWVKPMVKRIKKELPHSKITVFIPPCTFASGREVPVVESFPEVDQVIGPGDYIRYVIFRQNIFKKKPKGFRPANEGFVLFLGGDLGHATLLGKRFNFPIYAYSERDAGHDEKIRLFFVPSEKVETRLKSKGINSAKIRIVGDLMLDAVKPDFSKEEIRQRLGIDENDKVINIFPGSRPHELVETVPLFLKSLTLLKEKMKIIITLAPFITLDNFQKFLKGLQDSTCKISDTGIEGIYNLTIDEHKFIIYQGNSYNSMQVSNLALSLPGTNNVELAAMEIPTLVILPLNRPELIPLPGLVGIIGQIPLLGSFLKRKIVIPKLLPKFKFISPVNRSADEKIFPELIGVLTPKMIAERIREVLEQEIFDVKERLQNYKKEEKAAEKIISEIRADLLSFH